MIFLADGIRHTSCFFKGLHREMNLPTLLAVNFRDITPY